MRGGSCGTAGLLSCTVPELADSFNESCATVEPMPPGSAHIGYPCGRKSLAASLLDTAAGSAAVGLLLWPPSRHNWAMDPDVSSRSMEASGSTETAPAEAQPGNQVMLAEYSALRSEVDRRANIQWNVLALQITSAGVIASLAISRPADIALLLVIPLLSYMLGSRYILHDYHLKLISRYIRDSLSGRLQGNLAWEAWKADQMEPDVQGRNWFTATGWNLVHPTRLAFEGVGWLALLAAAFAAAYAWRDKVPAWGLILGFALLWVLGAVATHFLHRSFNRSAEPEAHPKAQDVPQAPLGAT